MRHLVPPDGGDGVAGVESPHHDNRGTEREEADGEEGEAVHVEHGQRRQVDIVTSRPRVLRRLEPDEQLRHGDQVAVRQHHPLAPPRRPRRVEDDRRVVLAHHRDRRLGAVAAAAVEHGAERGEHALVVVAVVGRGGMVQDFGHGTTGQRGGSLAAPSREARTRHAGGPRLGGDLGGGAGGVHGGGDGAGGEHGEERDGERDGVWEEQQHNGPLPNAMAAAEPRGEGGDEAAEVGAGHRGRGGGVDEEAPGSVRGGGRRGGRRG